jgi:hypothetical protein
MKLLTFLVTLMSITSARAQIITVPTPLSMHGFAMLVSTDGTTAESHFVDIGSNANALSVVAEMDSLGKACDAISVSLAPRMAAFGIQYQVKRMQGTTFYDSGRHTSGTEYGCDVVITNLPSTITVGSYYEHVGFGNPNAMAATLYADPKILAVGEFYKPFQSLVTYLRVND